MQAALTEQIARAVGSGPPPLQPVVSHRREIRPQPRQEMFLSSPADIAIYGGSAYSGKTYSLLLDPLRWKHFDGMSVVYFRRTMKQADNPGGLWDDSCSLYGSLGAAPFVGRHEHRWPNGFSVQLAGMEHVNDRFEWDGAQIPVIYWDQLEHFEWIQFWYMLSRNRDPTGRIRPYCRATCNPDPDSWLAQFIAWWIDPAGYAIPERAGLIRWFVRRPDDSLAWADTREELLEAGYGDRQLPVDHPEQPWMSVTYIYGTIYDNEIGMRQDPTYLAKLRNLGRVERERLLGDVARGGNWKVRAAAGLLFRRDWCELLDTPPSRAALISVVRGWDLAATEKREDNNPAFTVGVKLGRYATTPGRVRFVVLDVRRGQWSPAKVECEILKAADDDGRSVRIRLPQDPGQAGKDQVQRLVGLLAGYDARARPETGDKETRFNPFSAQAERGNVDIVKGEWNDDYFRVLEGFPDANIKDDADATSSAFDEVVRIGGPIDMTQAGTFGGAEAGAEGAAATTGDSPWNMGR